ncbi:hypothetical protein CDV31_001645 [Fusarium ambrosium]|uniref:Uncharacterized protein n=1 Tax=Fusarium ambrosium TaxID=131363 RepID=A0A428UYW5_9HYPO|nr:hypothetical protein CDV31_001645 [Fusarium ambrosium]
MPVMEPQIPILLRRESLTDSAAGLVENRAHGEVLFQPGEPPAEIDYLRQSSEFVNEHDTFVPKGVVFDSREIYRQSQKSLQTFRWTVQKLVAVLKERNVDTQLNITIKDPSEFTCDYVLQLIDKIQERRDNAIKTSSCKNFVRRCYQKVEDNRGAIEAFLTIIPNDAYGSVISGGFAMIMAAVEERAEHREAIQNFLAEIPEKLETIQRLSQIHLASIRLHLCADAVMVAVFTVLERIIDEITKAQKIKLQDRAKSLVTGIRFLQKKKSKADGVEELNADVAGDKDDGRELQKPPSIADALTGLQDEIHRFQREVDICNHESLGRMQIAVGDLRHGLRFVTKQNSDTQAIIADSLRELEELFSRNTKDAYMALAHHLEDALQRLCANNANFGAKIGKVIYLAAKPLRGENEVMSISSQQENNIRIASKWQKKLRGFPYDPMTDIKDCLKHIDLLDSDEKNMSRSILHSEQLDRWLQGKKSSIMGINLHTPPASLNNPVSFTSALSATALRSTAQFPVLAFFCAHRNNDSISEDQSGPVALVKSLVGQLLTFISDNRPSVDLTELGEYGFLPKAKKDVKAGLKALAALLSLLPEEDMVFIIIDSLSRLSGSGEERMIKKLVQIIRQREDLVIKVMVTDALPGSYIRNVADISLYIPDIVSGPGVVDISRSSDKIAKKVKQNRHIGDGDGDVTVDDDANDDSEKDDNDDEDLWSDIVI